MAKRFKRSLIGYNPKWVESKLKTLQEEFEKSSHELNDLLLSITSKNNILHEQIDTISEEIDVWKNMENKIANTLLEAHTQSVMKVYEANKHAEQLENNKLEQISQSKKENANLITAMNNLTKELQYKVEEYIKKFETFDIDKRREHSAI